MFSLLIGLVLAQEIIATPSAEITASPSPIPTSIPTVTPAPTPTTNPNIALFADYSREYNRQLFIYQQDYLDYSNKINVHTQYNTITTLNDKIEATKKVLITRNHLLRTYLTALRVKLQINQDQDFTTSQSIAIEINKWEDWLNEQNSIAISVNNLNDIRTFANNFKNKYPSIQQVIYTGLVQNEINLRLHTLGLIKQLQTDIGHHPDIQSETKEWLSSITVKSDLVTAALQDAYNLTQKSQSMAEFTNFYPKSKEKLNQANTYLLEIYHNLQSIITKFLLK